MPSNWLLKKVTIVPRLAGVLESIIQTFHAGFENIANGQEDKAQGGLSPSEIEAENRRLKKENKRLEMEREILKKAAAFFAKESN